MPKEMLQKETQNNTIRHRKHNSQQYTLKTVYTQLLIP